MRVALLMGGRSAEREISLRTGRGIAQALRALGHDVAAIDAADGRLLAPSEEEKGSAPAAAASDLPAVSIAAVAEAERLSGADVVFLALHGGAGEDGTVQALLELADKPYTGSGVLASALAMNKAMAKRVFEHAGIPTPAWRLVNALEPSREIDVAALGGYPIVVKPNTQGSTVGLSIVAAPGELPEALDAAFAYGPDVLIERFVPGRELTVAVLGDEPLPIVEIAPKSGFYDYTSKYTAGMSEYTCPAELPEPLAARVRELGLSAVRVLGCEGVARVDFRLDPEDQPWCLEVNTIPGMTATSLVPMAARARGLSYEQLVQRMIDLAAESHRRRRTSGGAPSKATGTLHPTS